MLILILIVLNFIYIFFLIDSSINPVPVGYSDAEDGYLSSSPPLEPVENFLRRDYYSVGPLPTTLPFRSETEYCSPDINSNVSVSNSYSIESQTMVANKWLILLYRWLEISLLFLWCFRDVPVSLCPTLERHMAMVSGETLLQAKTPLVVGGT